MVISAGGNKVPAENMRPQSECCVPGSADQRVVPVQVKQRVPAGVEHHCYFDAEVCRVVRLVAARRRGSGQEHLVGVAFRRRSRRSDDKCGPEGNVGSNRSLLAQRPGPKSLPREGASGIVMPFGRQLRG